MFDHCRVKAAHGQVGILISASNFRMFRRLTNRLVSLRFSIASLAPFERGITPKTFTPRLSPVRDWSMMPRTARDGAFGLFSPSYLSSARQRHLGWPPITPYEAPILRDRAHRIWGLRANIPPKMLWYRPDLSTLILVGETIWPGFCLLCPSQHDVQTTHALLQAGTIKAYSPDNHPERHLAHSKLNSDACL